MSGFSASPLALSRVLNERWPMVVDLTKRDALGRYKNSWLGVIWSLVTPILMLIVYTFVFSGVFNVRWSGGTGSRTEFALVLFSGLIVFNIFAECITKAPGLIVGNANLVKKVVFPLEVLPVVNLLSSLFHAAIGFLILIVFQLVFYQRLSPEIVLLPLVLAPYCLFVLGLSWFVSALAVYVRDVAQTIGVAVSALMFLSPVFFPSSALPAKWRFLVTLNPLAAPIEQSRELLMWGRAPDGLDLLRVWLVGAAIAWIGFAWFQKVRKGFADVL